MKDIAELKGNFIVDGAHSSVAFSVKHIVTDTRGTINIDSGNVNLDNANGPKIFIRLDMTSLNTQNSYRDGHLKDKSEFFDVTKNKKAMFEATTVEKISEPGKYSYLAKGKLTLKGVAKDIELRFNYIGLSSQEWEGKKVDVAGFEGETIIKRTDFGVGEGGGVGEDVKIEITLEASQEKK
ncbi:MAG: YceI family protein [Bacteroidota bacterium]|nr:YceI family protein [Bacteroidota bacterium]MDP3147179.1 YceI family protein [Bacteroidota bacterium]